MMKRTLLLMILMAILASGTLACAVAEEPMSILLLGTDSLGNELVTEKEEMSRADAIYVLSLHPNTGAIKLLSIERDYLVTLPGDLGDNKLATATYFGGPQMCLDAVNKLFKLEIGIYLQTDIAQLVQVLDAIGGVDIEIKPEEVELTNRFMDSIRSHSDLTHVVQGVNRLMGPETWAFLAIRDRSIDEVESNKDRNDRQKRAIVAGLERLSDMSFDEAMAAVDVVMPFVQTNMTFSEILSLVQIAQQAQADEFAYMRTPSSSYTRRRAGLHQVVIADDMPQEISAIEVFLFE